MPTLTLSGKLNELRKEGYVEDFNLHQNMPEWKNERINMNPEEFTVDKVYRFEGDSNPSDSSILYAISSETNQLKGILVNAYGIYSETATDELVKKLKIKK